MCRWLTYTGRPVYLECLLYEPVNSLIQQSLHARKARVPTNGDGFGFGWYGEREVPGLYRETLPAWNDPNLKSLAHQISSRMFFAHVRASTGTATSRANCHPFAHGRWMFMHNGQIGGYEKVRRVPFGEYMPLRGLLDTLGAPVDQVPRDAIAGTGPAVLDLPTGDRLAVVRRDRALSPTGVRRWC